MMKIKRDDLVKVIAGKDKGKEGKVIAVNHKEGTVLDVYKRQLISWLQMDFRLE